MCCTNDQGYEGAYRGSGKGRGAKFKLLEQCSVRVLPVKAAAGTAGYSTV
jgi:hypothetical protein